MNLKQMKIITHFPKTLAAFNCTVALLMTTNRVKFSGLLSTIFATVITPAEKFT